METSATIVRNGVSTTIRVTITFPDEYSPDKLQIVSNPVLIYEPNIDIKIPIPEVDNVYLIRQGNTNKYKIGHSIHPYKRISPLQTGNSEKLEIVACCAGGVIREGYLHDKYKKNKRINEWFEFNDEEANLIIKEFRSYRLNPDVPCDRSSPQKVIERNKVGDHKVVEQKVVDNKIVEQNIIQQKAVDNKVVDQKVIKQKVVNNRLVDEVVDNKVVNNKSSNHMLIGNEFFLKQISLIKDYNIYHTENKPFIFTRDLFDIYIHTCLYYCPKNVSFNSPEFSVKQFTQAFKFLNPELLSHKASIYDEICEGYFIPESFYNNIRILITTLADVDDPDYVTKTVTIKEWMDNYRFVGYGKHIRIVE